MSSTTSLGLLGEFAALHHGALTRRQAANLGVGRSAIRRLVDRRVLAEPVPGVLVVVGSPSTWEQRVYVATLACREQGLAIGPTAARLHGVDGFGPREDDGWIHVAVPRGRRLPMAGVRVSQTADTYPLADRYTVHGIPCAGLARTVCDVAAISNDALIRSFDHVQRRGFSPTWVEQTARRLHSPGRKAIPSVLAEVERRRGNPALRGSWFEKLVEDCLRSPAIPGLMRQHVIRDEDGGFIARVDLAVPSVRLAIEAHSREHHTVPDAQGLDERRESRAKLEGWEFEYVGWYHTTHTPVQVCKLIERLVARRALDLGVDLTRVRG